MTQITRAHREIANAVRGHAAKVSGEVGVSGRVERCHRADGYREVRATSRDPAHIAALRTLVEAEPALSARAVEVTLESGALTPGRDLHALDICIWPGRRKAA